MLYLHWLSMNDSNNLSKRVISGGIWVFSLRITNRLISLARTLIIARLVLPEDFGIIGIALLFISALETFTVTGFDTALVQRSSVEDRFWDTAWIAAALRGAALAGLIYLAAPWVGAFFGRPDSVSIIRIMALWPLVRGFTNMGVWRFVKDLNFRRQFVYEFSITFADAAVAIPLAIIYRNVLALAAGILAGQVAGLVVSWLYHPLSVRFRFDRAAFKELFGFGRWITGSSILNFLLIQGDDLVVGRMLGATPLGLYQMAYRLSCLPATEIAQVISKVTFPAYSKMQDDPERVGAAFLRVVRFTTLASFPLGVIIVMLGPDFVRVVLGPNWEPMIPAFQILAVYGVIYSVGSCLGPVLVGMGRPDVLTKIQFAKLLIMLAIIFPMVKYWGIAGAAGAAAVNAVIMNPVGDYIVMKHVGRSMLDFVKSIFPSLILAGVAGLAIAFPVLLLDSPFFRLAIGIITFSVTMILGALVLEKWLGLSLFSAFSRILPIRKGRE